MKLHIADMLRAQKREHVSFHTPGHKRAGWDVTELSYSDNLYAPHGAIAAAQEDAARILGADASYFLTDGSTAGVFSMMYALRAKGARSVAASSYSHPSVAHAAKALGMELVPIRTEIAFGIAQMPSKEALEESLSKADALFVTSPDYYGFFAPLRQARALCDRAGKPLAVDGAHGSHLHFTPFYAGKFADMWVDGVHKSLPALTQGAVVSARGGWKEALFEGVRAFRTTSPSYPILASVEYAVKYPRNEAIERAAETFKCAHGCVKNDDWTKILVPFGEKCAAAQSALEEAGIYPEFQDGNYLLFYLSPCTKEEELGKLGELLGSLPRGDVGRDAPCGAVPIYREPL